MLENYFKAHLPVEATGKQRKCGSNPPRLPGNGEAMSYKPTGTRYLIDSSFAALDFMTSQLQTPSSSPRLALVSHAHRPALPSRSHSPTHTEHVDANPHSARMDRAIAINQQSPPDLRYEAVGVWSPETADAQTQTWQTTVDMAGVFTPTNVFNNFKNVHEERDNLRAELASLRSQVAELQRVAAARRRLCKHVAVQADVEPASSSSLHVSAYTPSSGMSLAVTEVAHATETAIADTEQGPPISEQHSSEPRQPTITDQPALSETTSQQRKTPSVAKGRKRQLPSEVAVDGRFQQHGMRDGKRRHYWVPKEVGQHVSHAKKECKGKAIRPLCFSNRGTPAYKGTDEATRWYGVEVCSKECAQAIAKSAA